MKLTPRKLAMIARSSVAVLALGAVTLVTTPVVAQSKPEIRISTGRPGGSYYVIGAALAEAIYRSGEAKSATSESSSGSVENARLVGKGTVQFGMMDGGWASVARAGTKPFKKKIDLMVAAPAHRASIFFITTDETGIKKMSDLRGKRVAVGGRGSGMEQHSIKILDGVGLGIKGIKPAYLGFGGGGAALREGRIVAQIQCCYPNRGLTELTQLKKSAIVPLSKAQRDSLIAKWPAVYSNGVIPKGAIKGHDKDMDSLWISNSFFTHRSTPEQTVYLLAKTLIAKIETLRKKSPHFDTVKTSLDMARKGGRKVLETAAPLHPGALRALREAGILK